VRWRCIVNVRGVGGCEHHGPERRRADTERSHNGAGTGNQFRRKTFHEAERYQRVHETK
jgi:hypothetical protein